MIDQPAGHNISEAVFLDKFNQRKTSFARLLLQLWYGCQRQVFVEYMILFSPQISSVSGIDFAAYIEGFNLSWLI